MHVCFLDRGIVLMRARPIDKKAFFRMPMRATPIKKHSEETDIDCLGRLRGSSGKVLFQLTQNGRTQGKLRFNCAIGPKLIGCNVIDTCVARLR